MTIKSNIPLAVTVLADLSKSLNKPNSRISTNGIKGKIEKALTLLTSTTGKKPLADLLRQYPSPFEIERILEETDPATLTDQERKELIKYPHSLLRFSAITENLATKALAGNLSNDERMDLVCVIAWTMFLQGYAYEITNRCTAGEFSRYMEKALIKKSNQKVNK